VIDPEVIREMMYILEDDQKKPAATRGESRSKDHLRLHQIQSAVTLDADSIE